MQPLHNDSYDVLIYTQRSTRFGLGERWFIVGSFKSRLEALNEFQTLNEEFHANATIIILAVKVRYDAQTGRFKDSIFASRGIAPLINRREMNPLTRDDRKKLIAATAPIRQHQQTTPSAQHKPSIPWGSIAGLCALIVFVMSFVLYR